MFDNENAHDFVQQPLMSTGTTEPGFSIKTEKSKQEVKPKIGETIIGDDGHENQG